MGWTAVSDAHHRREGRKVEGNRRVRHLPGVTAMLVFGVALLLAACSRGAPPQEGGAPQGPVELRVAVGEDTFRTDPDRGNVGMYPIRSGIFETLVVLTPDYGIVPGLAERWEYRGENTWRFYLRQGVKFHNGEPLTAEAVRYSFQRIARTGGGTAGLREDSVRVVDDYTVDIVPGHLNLRLVEQLAHPTYSIVAPGTNPGENPVGTGPYRFVEYQKGQRLVVERFDGYWGEPAGYDRVTFRFIPDGNTRVLALRGGEVDIAVQVPREAIREVASIPGVRLLKSRAGAYHALYVMLNGTAPYDLGADAAIRRAVAYAINRDAIIDDVWAGAAEPNTTFIPAGVLGPHASEIQGVPYDPARAAAILDEAGWQRGPDGIREKNGRRLSLTLVAGFPNADAHRPLPELLQGQLREAGIDVSIVTAPDLGSYIDRLSKGEGDLWAEIGNQNDANPCFLPEFLFHSQSVSDEGPYGKWFGPGEAYDRLIEGCRNAATTDEAQMWAARSLKMLIDEVGVLIPVAGIVNVYAVAERVADFEPHPSGVNQRWEAVRPAR